MDVETSIFDVERSIVNTGDDIRGGDVDNGETVVSGGDALFLRDIGGLVDHNVEVFSLEQVGIFFFSFDFALKTLLQRKKGFTSKGTELICRKSLFAGLISLEILRNNRLVMSIKKKKNTNETKWKQISS